MDANAAMSSEAECECECSWEGANDTLLGIALCVGMERRTYPTAYGSFPLVENEDKKDGRTMSLHGNHEFCGLGRFRLQGRVERHTKV